MSSRGFAQGRPTCAPPARTLEVRTNGDADPLKQYVWDLRYIDAPVLRWRDENTDGTVDDTLYSLNDANMNITAVVDGSDGDVVERYAYDPYGKVTVLNGEDDADGGVSNWSADADNVSDWDNRILYCGYRLDPETGADGQGIMHVRRRPYHCTMGRWTVWDLEGYVEGLGLQEYCQSRPVQRADPLGSESRCLSLTEKAWRYATVQRMRQDLMSRIADDVDAIMREKGVPKFEAIDEAWTDERQARISLYYATLDWYSDRIGLHCPKEDEGRRRPQVLTVSINKSAASPERVATVASAARDVINNIGAMQAVASAAASPAKTTADAAGDGMGVGEVPGYIPDPTLDRLSSAYRGLPSPTSWPGMSALPYLVPGAAAGVDMIMEDIYRYKPGSGANWYVWISYTCVECKCSERKSPTGLLSSYREWTPGEPEWLQVLPDVPPGAGVPHQLENEAKVGDGKDFGPYSLESGSPLRRLIRMVAKNALCGEKEGPE